MSPHRRDRPARRAAGRLFAPLALAMLLLAAAPVSAAPEPYPAPLVEPLAAWVDEAEAFAADDHDATWWPTAERFLDLAKEARDEERLRVGMFHLETFYELVITGRLMDEANATHTSAAERKAFVTERTRAMKVDAEDAWETFREELHGYDGRLHSLQSIEQALYAADVALGGAQLIGDHDLFAQEWTKNAYDRSYALALVRSTHTPALDVRFATELLARGLESEGLPPRVNETAWENLTASVLQPVDADSLPPYLTRLEELAAPVRENGEALMALTIALAEQRAARANGMTTIFGDAESRGKNVVADAGRGMNRLLVNTTLETPTERGLLGVFTADAVDRASYTNRMLDNDTASLGIIIVAWSALDHASYVWETLGIVSPIRPAVNDDAEPVNKTPGTGAVGLALAVGAAVLVARRRGAP